MADTKIAVPAPPEATQPQPAAVPGAGEDLPDPDVVKVYGSQTKAVKALELRKAGLPYWKIAEVVGYADAASTKVAITRLLKRIPHDTGVDFKSVQILQAEQLLAALWPQAMSGDTKAADTILRIQERLGKLVGVEQERAATHNTIVVVQGSTERDFIDGLKQGLEQHELPRGPGEDWEESDVWEAEVIEEAEEDDSDRDDGSAGEFDPATESAA